MTRIRTALGLMSGTSMDGIDIALIQTDGEDYVVRGSFMGASYEPEFRERLKRGLDKARALKDRRERPGDLAALERNLTLRHAVAVSDFLYRHGLGPADVDVIGFHGQTVLHRPSEALTVQLGDGALLAAATGIAVVYDMRAHDMDHGGQGAPLIPAYHAALSRQARAFDADGPVVFVNIGGISNLTFIGTDGKISAYDSGPGNTLIDQWVEAQTGNAFDSGGSIAAGGQIVQELADRYLAHPFFSSNQRRSLDRNDFAPPGQDEASLEDGARTLAHVTAAAILRSAAHLPEPPRTWIVSGGGRHNSVIMDDLRALAEAQGGKVRAAEEAGFDGDAMEAEAWAYLAVRSLDGKPLTFPETTGVSMAITGGVLARP